MKSKHKCIKCDLIPCVNLYRKVNDVEGGELYLYESTIKNRVHVPCEFGVLIHGLCKLLASIPITLSFEMYNQCIRDLKAVSLLVFTGHYRNAMQIMRPVIENFLTGLYWDMKLLEAGEDENVRQKVEDEHDRFTKKRGTEKYKLPKEDLKIAFGDTNHRRDINQYFLTRWLLAKGVIEKEGTTQIEKRIKVLNKYLHPAFQTTDFARAECSSCPSCVIFDEAEYKKCIRLFQDTTTLLLSTLHEYIITFSPEKLEDSDVQEALDMIQGMYKVEAEIGRRLIFSKELKEFIRELS